MCILLFYCFFFQPSCVAHALFDWLIPKKKKIDKLILKNLELVSKTKLKLQKQQH